jgi:hypothetical protein
VAASGGGQRSRVEWAVGSDGGLEGDGVAEGFELADVVALAAFGVDAGGVEPRAEVVEAASGSDSRCQAMTRMERPVATMASSEPAAAGDAPVPFAEEGGCLGGAGRGVAQGDGHVGVAVAGVLLGPLPPGPAPVPARGRVTRRRSLGAVRCGWPAPTRRVRARRDCTGDHLDYGGEADQPRSSSAWPPTTGRPPHVTRE